MPAMRRRAPCSDRAGGVQRGERALRGGDVDKAAAGRRTAIRCAIGAGDGRWPRRERPLAIHRDEADVRRVDLDKARSGWGATPAQARAAPRVDVAVGIERGKGGRGRGDFLDPAGRCWAAIACSAIRRRSPTRERTRPILRGKGLVRGEDGDKATGARSVRAVVIVGAVVIYIIAPGLDLPGRVKRRKCLLGREDRDGDDAADRTPCAVR